MRLVDQLYDWLSQGPTPGCDRIFAEALTHTEPTWAERIVRILLLRGHEASWAVLIGRYDKLTPEIHTLLQHHDDRMQAGIALAMKSPSPDKRVNALRALEERPHARLVYLLSDAIRDSAPKVRVLAGQVWRKTADEFLDRPRPPAEADKDTREAYEEERDSLRRALEDALRTFDLNKCLEVVEICLWFARDLGQTLWEKLMSSRSRAGMVVTENLRAWNHPRLAHFLISALRQPAWRESARQILQDWHTAPQVSALLAESDLLDDLEVRQGLRSVHNPKWFTTVGHAMTPLAPELRPLAPRWACGVGYHEAEKIGLLSRWLHSPDPDVQRAAVYALAEVDDAWARNLLKEVPDSNSPLASFARWSAVALDTEAVRGALDDPGTDSSRDKHRAAPDSDRSGGADADCVMLWQACRRTSPNQRGGLIAAFREHAEIWRPRLKAYLQSPDPCDRILVLQVISSEQLAHRFRQDLEPLLSDPVEGIRQLTETLLYSLSRGPAPSRAAAHGASSDQARRELRMALEWLADGAADPADADLIERVRELLREVYADQYEAAPAGVSTEGVS